MTPGLEPVQTRIQNTREGGLSLIMREHALYFVVFHHCVREAISVGGGRLLGGYQHPPALTAYTEDIDVFTVSEQPKVTRNNRRKQGNQS